jgi:hypothetical protein
LPSTPTQAQLSCGAPRFSTWHKRTDGSRRWQSSPAQTAWRSRPWQRNRRCRWSRCSICHGNTQRDTDADADTDTVSTSLPVAWHTLSSSWLPPNAAQLTATNLTSSAKSQNSLRRVAFRKTHTAPARIIKLRGRGPAAQGPPLPSRRRQCSKCATGNERAHALPLLAAGVGLGEEHDSAYGKDEEADGQGAHAGGAHLLDCGARSGNPLACETLAPSQ